MTQERKARIRFAIDKLQVNPDFTLQTTELMPLVEAIDTLFAERDDMEVERAQIIERLEAQAQRIADAKEDYMKRQSDANGAYSAYSTAQATLKQAQDAQDVMRISDAETALQVAQAAYELASTEYYTAEQAYMDVLREANGVLVSTEAEQGAETPVE